MNEIKNYNCIVTGASSGIGRSIAISLAKEGLNLVISGRNENRLNETKNECEKEGVKVFCFSKDLLVYENSKELILFAKEKLGSIDVLINCAGIAHNNLFVDVSNELYDSVMNTNVKIPFMLMKEVIPSLRESHGTIINISSVVGIKGYPNQSIYTASKHALVGMSKAVAKEEYKNDVRVHVLCPGAIMTDMIKLTRPDLIGTNLIPIDDILDIIIFLLKHRTSSGVIDEIDIHRSLKEPFI